MNTVFLEGHRVQLRGLTRADLDGPMSDWNNDHLVTRYLFRGAFPSTPERLERDFAATAHSTADVELAIVAKETQHHIGITGLHSLNWIGRSAEFRILIGDRRYWGKGLATETSQLMVAYAFEILNLHRVWLGVNSDNQAAIKAYTNAGFRQEGELRDEIFRNGRYYAVTRMGILVPEYQEIKTSWQIYPQLQSQFPA